MMPEATCGRKASRVSRSVFGRRDVVINGEVKIFQMFRTEAKVRLNLIESSATHHG